ncbi:acyltransferase family protein [Pedobacter sp. LMG 31464]|uniref:Acyltransferase family protein n=1 Tax=Pedobacter planticolens TaxID=2679964 RepID=A0A923IWI8_9SPHI|nr:acyltransferase family protein [Pedobacter planticolens]MBB2147196.1 acyltransferase family protein [Pedobacter planticolens]
MSDFKVKDDTSWLDNLRVIATIGVIFLHVAAPFLYKFTKISGFNWWTANVYDSLVRFCVPVFVMITGALLLPKDYQLNDYLKKRVARIIFPFLFWIAVYSIHILFILKKGFELPIFKMLTISSSAFGYKITYHFWYIYMIIGIYLFIPIISKWIKNAKENELVYFLVIWLIAVLIALPIFSNYIPDFNLKYFGGFIGYIVLGYYLSVRNFENVKHIKTISLLIFASGVLLTIFGTYFLSTYNGHFRIDLYTYFSPNVILAAVGLFLFIKHTNSTNSTLKAIRKFLNKHSFGIYFIHMLVLYYLNKYGLNGAVFGPVFGIPITTIACLAISSLLIFLLKKLGLEKVVG